MNTQEEFKDGWVGFTKADLKKMYDTNTAQWPVWCRVNGGNPFGLLAEETLRANGLHPDKIPSALRDHVIAGKLIRDIAEIYPLQYVETPNI